MMHSRVHHPRTCDGTKVGTYLSDQGVADTLGSVGAKSRILNQPEQILHGQSAHLSAQIRHKIVSKVPYVATDPTPKNNGCFATDDHLFQKRSCPP